MFKKLVIKNYQKHQSFSIDLQPITVIVGHTDSGKSSILRALRWLCLNKPGGLSFLRNGSKNVEVFLILDDDGVERKIARLKAKDENLYVMDGETYEGFSSNVPQPIETILNIGDDNFQRQHDAPYWFSLSPGEVSRELNKIINLDVIDSTLRNLSSEVRGARAEVDVSRKRLKEAKEERNNLLWIKEAHEEFLDLQGTESNLANKREKRAALASIIKEVGEASKALRLASGGKKQGSVLASLLQRQREVQVRRETLSDILKEITQCQEVLEEEAHSITALRKEIERKTKGRCPVCGKALTKKL